ncbi:DUF1707 SHOCT-like domain-containing protein [Auraticoccus cholistanensis]|nr:DUF1707 domain-containing protein [Auraticoccus cholistanensis]
MSEQQPQLRIGDRERDLVASVLQDAMAEGRITMEEMQERVDAALRARYFSDLDPLVADLPIEPPSTALTRPRPGVEPRLASTPGSSEADRLVLDAGWSSVARTGRWDVPPFIEINASLGSVKLDCLQAVAPPVVDIRVIGSAGSVTIVVPETWAANVDRLRTGWGSAHCKLPTSPQPGGTLLVLHGSVGMGTLNVRNANWFDRRKLEKQGITTARRPELGR